MSIPASLPSPDVNSLQLGPFTIHFGCRSARTPTRLLSNPRIGADMNQRDHPGKKKNALKPSRSPEQEAQRKQRTRRVCLHTGQVLMIVGAFIAIQHWLAHLGAFGAEPPPLWLDLAAGYPMGAVLLVAGAILAGLKPR